MNQLPADLSNLGAISAGRRLAALKAVEQTADEYEEQGYFRLLPGQPVGELIATIIRFDVLPLLREILAADPSEPIAAAG